jgi:hypothetical protein
MMSAAARRTLSDTPCLTRSSSVIDLTTFTSTMPKSPWLPSPYNLWNPDHIHALGAVAATYNELEYSLFSLFLIYSHLSHDIAQPLFQNMSRAQRQDFLEANIAQTEGDEEIKGHLSHFIKCFAICADNRNFLLHSTLHPGETANDVMFMKSSREYPTRDNKINADIHIIRNTAKTIASIDAYGTSLFAYIAAFAAWFRPKLTNFKVNGVPYVPKLPGKPALPRMLLMPPPKAARQPKRLPESPRQRRERALKARGDG